MKGTDRAKGWVLAAGCGVAAAALLFCSASVGEGIRRGRAV